MPHTRKLEPDIRCPLEYGLEVFGGKWKSRILCVLSKKQTLRYGQLREEMTNISDAVLSSSLRSSCVMASCRGGASTRYPPRVEYSLTERGESVVPILRDICKWAGLTNREETTDAPRQCQVCDFVDVKVVPARTDAPLVPGTRR